MIATSFRTLADVVVYRPRSLAEAVRIASETELPPALLAGGTDMVAQFNEGRSAAEVVALAGLDELREITLRDDALHLGAMVTHADGSLDATVRRVAPGFAAAWGKIANVRVRFTATLGGNLMARRTRYEMPVLLSALHGRVHFEGPGTPDSIAADSLAQHAPAARAILTRAVIPLRGLVAFDYDRTLRPIMTLALCIRRVGDELRARAAIGTEAMQPHVLDFGFGHGEVRRIASNARDTAHQAFAALPVDVRDPYTSNAYLRGAGTALLTRALARVANGAD